MESSTAIIYNYKIRRLPKLNPRIIVILPYHARAMRGSISSAKCVTGGTWSPNVNLVSCKGLKCFAILQFYLPIVIPYAINLLTVNSYK